MFFCPPSIPSPCDQNACPPFSSSRVAVACNFISDYWLRLSPPFNTQQHRRQQTSPPPACPTPPTNASTCNSNNHFQYLNLKGFSLPHGFGMGGSTEAFRFFIPEALDDTCIGRSACLTFEQGELCPDQSRRFEVDIMEVRVARYRYRYGR